MLASLTTAIAQHGFAAVFALMAVDALLPVGGELVMLYAGVLAAGTVVASHPSLLGWTPAPGLAAYIALALCGTLGYLAGALAGWALGTRGGRPLIERHGRLLHLSRARFARAEAWFDRRGRAAVFLGRITPLVRSFISIPAGVLGSPLGPYTLLTLLGSALWCFAFAGAGWALGGSWETLHHDFRYVDYAIAAVVVIGVAVLLARFALRRPAPGR
jgi:membrane protein DedA with SNARE-associated domain